MGATDMARRAADPRVLATSAGASFAARWVRFPQCARVARQCSLMPMSGPLACSRWWDCAGLLSFFQRPFDRVKVPVTSTDWSRFRHLGGVRVLVADIDSAAGERVAGAIGEAATPFTVDVSDADQCAAMVAAAVDTFGRLDVAVNNAGIAGPSAPVGEYLLDGWREVMAVHLDGTFYCCRAEIAVMKEAGGGSIVNMASIPGSTGFQNAPAYIAAKQSQSATVLSRRWTALLVRRAAHRQAAHVPGTMRVRTPQLESLQEEQPGEVTDADRSYAPCVRPQR